MAVIIDDSKVEFELVVKKSYNKNRDNGMYGRREPETPEWEEIERLEFKSLSAVEVLRKILDYLHG